ncbi:coenzyme F420-0:L-glutamate ligase [Candidatus Curtissbacteria bacterium]|nr:coenzyme F420-0:L-glutamate ligase [Candidatus Curtissbacteria bacterium]
MHIFPIKIRILLPPKDDLESVILECLPALKERDIIAITSKVVAIGEERCVPVGDKKVKEGLVKKEADYFAKLPGSFRSIFTVKRHTLVGAAGIDESNGNGF